MSIRVGDVKRWDVFTIAEEVSELHDELLIKGKTLDDDDDMYDEIYSLVDALHVISEELLAVAQVGGEVTRGYESWV